MDGHPYHFSYNINTLNINHFQENLMSSASTQFPSKRKTKSEVLAAMQAARQKDVRWQDGKAFSLVYYAGEEVSELVKEAYQMYFSENALNPTAFHSLRKFEAEVIAMCASLLGGDESVTGTMTSGGTESLLMTVKTAREWGRLHKPQADPPEMVLPMTAHPAFEKAANYFGVKPIHVPVGEDFRAQVNLMEKAITPNTVLMVGSAPSYPQGVVDPIPELAAVAQKHDFLFHVDACVGGFMLPFVRKLGYPVPNFDFQVAGVTSMSADLHKYGYAAKGASVILYRSHDLRLHQFFVHTDWAGGIYASPAMAGSRPGGAIAAAWAVLNFLGEEGYLEIVRKVMQATDRLKAGVAEIEGVHVLSNPEMSVVALASDEHNIYDIGDEMTLNGWYMDRQQFPASLHVTLNYAHAEVIDDFIHDLSVAVIKTRKPSWHKFRDTILLRVARVLVRWLPEKLVSKIMGKASGLLGVEGSDLPQRSAAMYGMMGTLPNRGDLKTLVLDLLDQMFSVDK
jgi:glutamate/tyrosine decarboxylase-like PLP-dependent enzyme